jgi:hypothetical protein
MEDIEYCLKEIIDDATAMLDDCKSNTDPSSDAAARIIDQAQTICVKQWIPFTETEE